MIRKEQLSFLQANWNSFIFNAEVGTFTYLPELFEEKSVTKVSGGSLYPEKRGILNNGLVKIRKESNGKPVEDNDLPVFGRLIYDGKYKLEYKKLVNGQEIEARLTNSQVLEMLYVEVMEFKEVPIKCHIALGQFLPFVTDTPNKLFSDIEIKNSNNETVFEIKYSENTITLDSLKNTLNIKSDNFLLNSDILGWSKDVQNPTIMPEPVVDKIGADVVISAQNSNLAPGNLVLSGGGNSTSQGDVTIILDKKAKFNLVQDLTYILECSAGSGHSAKINAPAGILIESKKQTYFKSSQDIILDSDSKVTIFGQDNYVTLIDNDAKCKKCKRPMSKWNDNLSICFYCLVDVLEKFGIDVKDFSSK